MDDIGKIIGLPIKIFSNRQIYIPMEYLRFYGISQGHDKLRIFKSNHCLIYCPCTDNTLNNDNSDIVSIRVGLTPIPLDFMYKNGLSLGDTVYLLGTTKGLLVYTKNNTDK
jgi:hypothetical protein